MEGQELPYDAFAYREKRSSSGGAGDICTLTKARARAVTVSSVFSSSAEPVLFLSIELVGTRFLRKMVRILAATAIREACKVWSVDMTSATEESCSYTTLVDIATTGDRLLTSAPLPGEGLCMCGVGYELQKTGEGVQTIKQPTQPKATAGAFGASDNGGVAGMSLRNERKERKKRARLEVQQREAEDEKNEEI